MSRKPSNFAAGMGFAVCLTILAPFNSAFALDLDDIEDHLPRLRASTPLPVARSRERDGIPSLTIPGVPQLRSEELAVPLSERIRIPQRPAIIIPIEVDD